MNVRSYTKRLLAMLLCVMLVVGMLPTTVFAAETGALVDAAIFCSDVHTGSSYVTSIFTGIKNADSTFDPTTAAFVGDTQMSASTVTAAAQGVFNGVECIYSYGDHDGEGDYGIADTTGVSYGANNDTNYYIYSISETAMAMSSPDTSGFTSAVEKMDKTKPLFIISHMPLHYRRGDNNGAETWYNAISAAAKEMDIAFFWAHNHTSESDADRNAYYVEKNGSETITLENGTSDSKEEGSTVTPNFTYLNAGYVKPPNNAARMNVATGVRIYENAINYTVYNASGELTGSYAVNETVEREFAKSAETVVTLESIAISGTTEYTVGDALALTVTATYSDGSTKDVTSDATITGYDMNTAGTQTVTATYEGLTATYEITVAATEKTVNYVVLNEGDGATYTVGQSLLYQVVVTYSDYTTEKFSQDDCEVVSVENILTGDAIELTAAMNTPGSYAATVAYQGVTCGSMVYFTVTESGDSSYDLLNLVINGAEVTADVQDVTDDETVVTAMETVEGIDDYVAYDITADLAEGSTATVSIPVSTDWAEGEFTVYYITDDGAISDETFEPTYADGYVTFTATHFSTYTVTVTLPDNTTVDTEGDTAVVEGTGSYESTPVTVYKLVETPEVGKQYLIVHDNDGGGYGLDSNTGAYSTTTFDATGYYTTWNESTNTGTAVSADDVYATATSPFLWTVGGSAGAYTFINGSYTLGATCYESGFLWWTSTEYSLNFTGTGGYQWAYTGNTLSTTYSDDDFSNETIYLARSGSTWSAAGSGASSVYFYEPVTLYYVTYSGTEGGVYTATGADQLDVVTSNGKTVSLTSSLTFTTDSGTTTTVSDLTDWTVSYEKVTDNGVVSDVTTAGVATLSGTVGSETLKVTYTHATYGTAWDEFVVSTKQASGTTVTGTSGMHVDKTVELQADGTYTINLEAFSTGATVTTETETVKPADIVLVLDLSNSMDQGMSGGQSSSTNPKKITSLISAVQTFIDQVAASYSDTSDHRISIVVYNSIDNTAVSVDWTYVTEANATTMKTTVGGYSGDLAKGTNTGEGMYKAYQQLTTNYSYTGQNTDRSKVVVLFTDGEPTRAGEVSGSTSFNNAVAYRAIYYASLLKSSTVGATVYSVGVVSGADPDSTDYQTDPSSDDINFFLQAVSSNHPNASVTLPDSDASSVTLDANDLGTKSSSDYYLTATTAAELEEIFSNIGSSVSNSSSTTVTLDSTSVMKDIIGANFTVPGDTSFDDVEITVVTGSTTDGETFTFGTENVTDISTNVTYTVTDSTSVSGGKDINITGFSYKDYYITSDKEGDYEDHQYKLIVTISGITVADDATTDTVFATNGTGSGIYASGESTATVTFPQPQSVVTSKMYVLDYAKDVTLDENDWYAQTVDLATAYTTNSNYGTWSADGSALIYSPKTTMWGGYDTATVIGEVNDAFATAYPAAVATEETTNSETGVTTGLGANQQYVLSKVSVVPANNVYYEDDFITSEATGTVGIEFSDGWTVTGTADGNTEVPESEEDDDLGGVHGWIDSMDNDTTYSDGTAHVSSTVGSTATFSFTGTGVDVYSYTDMQSGMVTGKLYKVGDTKTLTKIHMIDNLAVSGDYYQIPTLSFNGLEYGTYELKLIVNAAKAPVVDENGKVVTENVYDDFGQLVYTKQMVDENGNLVYAETTVDENGNTIYDTTSAPVYDTTSGLKQAIVYSDTETRSTYYLDGIRVYNPLGATTSAYTGTNQTTIFTEVRDIILETGALDLTQNDTTVESAMFIDLSSDGTTAKLMGYEESEFYTYGPKNEVYLGAGQAIVFSVESAGNYYIGLKSPTGATTTAYLFGGNDYSVPFSHTTDQYYQIVPDDNGNICIYNGGSTMLSITKIQMVSEQAAVLTLGSITSEQAVSYAVASVASIDEIEETIPEETTPEETVPEETVPDIKVEIENKFNEAKNTLRGFVNKLFSSMSSWFGR